MAKILLINTGGTLTSRMGEQGLEPRISGKEILEEVDRKLQRRKHVLLSLLPRLADAGLFLSTDLDPDS